MLKQLWDYIFLVKTSVDEWKTTPWKDIDVENMDMECKKFSKDIRYFIANISFLLQLLQFNCIFIAIISEVWIKK